MKRTLLALTCLASSVAFAHGSSHPTVSAESSGGMVPIEVASRVMTFDHVRHWQNQTGEVLICLWPAEANYRMECTNTNASGVKYDAWVFLSQYRMPGYKVSGIQYQPVGTYVNLLVYFKADGPDPAKAREQETAELKKKVVLQSKPKFIKAEPTKPVTIITKESK